MSCFHNFLLMILFCFVVVSPQTQAGFTSVVDWMASMFVY